MHKKSGNALYTAGPNVVICGPWEGNKWPKATATDPGDRNPDADPYNASVQDT